MKVIKPNDIKIESLPKWETTNVLGAIKDFVEIDEKYIQYVKCEKDEKFLKCYMHPFVQAVHIAYAHHVPLTITPDVIFYLITSAISVHINQNDEGLRKVFVNHEGKKKLELRRDDLKFNDKSNPWHEVIDDFSAQIDKNTNNNVVDLLVANFSTTSKDARVVSQMVLMDSMQKYFEYGIQTCCGIPEIRIAGCKEDWENIQNKANSILKLMPDLKPWINGGLKEILDHFIGVFDDKIDKSFWNEIYKQSDESGGPFLSGWIVGLFPYLKEGAKNPYVFKKNWRESSKNIGLNTSSFDYHMNQIPFDWSYIGTKVKMLFVGGLVGIVSEKDTSLLPIFGYSIMEDRKNQKK